MKTQYLSPIRCPRPETLSVLAPFVTSQLAQHKMSSEAAQAFLRLLQRRFALDTISRKLEDWPSLDFATFVKELNKLLKKGKHEELSLTQELEWEPLFELKRAEVQALQAEITSLNREIDVAVYRLYGLSWEEVLVVDAGVEGWMGEGTYNSSNINSSNNW